MIGIIDKEQTMSGEVSGVGGLIGKLSTTKTLQALLSAEAQIEGALTETPRLFGSVKDFLEGKK